MSSPKSRESPSCILSDALDWASWLEPGFHASALRTLALAAQSPRRRSWEAAVRGQALSARALYSRVRPCSLSLLLSLHTIKPCQKLPHNTSGSIPLPQREHPLRLCPCAGLAWPGLAPPPHLDPRAVTSSLRAHEGVASYGIGCPACVNGWCNLGAGTMRGDELERCRKRPLIWSARLVFTAAHSHAHSQLGLYDCSAPAGRSTCGEVHRASVPQLARIL